MPVVKKRPNRIASTLAGEGVRLGWKELPAPVRAAIEERLGGPVGKVEVRRGGFSPAFAGILSTRSGGGVFVKAGGPVPEPDLPELYRREWRIASGLPKEVPAPRPLWSREVGGWVVLAYEAIPGGNPPLPWKAQDLATVLKALEEMSELLTPSPVRVPTLREHFAEAFQGFRMLWVKSRSIGRAALRLDPWAAQHLEELAELESEWENLTVGTTLLHNDIRADNIVLAQGRAFFVDWPHAAIGAPWVDLLGMLPSVAMQGGPKPWEVFDRSELGKTAPFDAVRACLAAMTGYFLERSLRPPSPGLPTLRKFQQAQGVESLAWLRRLTPELG